MNSFINTVKQYPVRTYGYSVSAAVLALLVYFSVISAGAVPVILALIGVVLSVGGTEAVHGAVTPVSKTVEPPVPPTL